MSEKQRWRVFLWRTWHNVSRLQFLNGKQKALDGAGSTSQLLKRCVFTSLARYSAHRDGEETTSSVGMIDGKSVLFCIFYFLCLKKLCKANLNLSKSLEGWSLNMMPESGIILFLITPTCVTLLNIFPVV